MKCWTQSVGCFLLLAGPFACHAAPPPAVIVTNARIWTGDASRPNADTLVVVGDRIVAVGSAREATRWRVAGAVEINAHGHRVLPGFNDAHVHMLDGGASLESVQLFEANNLSEMVERLRTYIRTARPGHWIRGGNWDDMRWSPPVPPTRDDIDAVTGEFPVALDRVDGHSVLANSTALRRAGITRETPDPPGGVIVRDASGEPNGILRDAAINLLTRAIPPISREERRRAIELALEHAVTLGVTSVQDMDVEPDTLAVYAELAAERRLQVRVYVATALMHVEAPAQIGIEHAFGGPWLRIGAVKGYADGSLSSGTAYFFEPFRDLPESRGLLSDEMTPDEGMRARLLRADERHLQICVHAIGDAAISRMLDLYGEVVAAHGPADRRLRIEHAQHMAAADFDRFARLGVIAVGQPGFILDDMPWAEARLGFDRASRSYAYRSFLDHGVRLAVSTDWPVVSLDPMNTIYAAATRASAAFPNGWFPEQRISVEDALTAYTATAAYAEFQEADKGTLSPGKLADFVIVDPDPLSVQPAALRDVKVIETWVGGARRYSRDISGQLIR